MTQNAQNTFQALTDQPHEVLWRDRKRHLGLPISFTRYSIEGDRFVTRIGFFRTVTDEILLYRILDLKLTRTLGQKILGVGTITLYTADQSDNQLLIRNIRKSDKVRLFLSRLIEQERERRRLAGRELFGVASAGMGDMGFVLPDYDGDGRPG